MAPLTRILVASCSCLLASYGTGRSAWSTVVVFCRLWYLFHVPVQEKILKSINLAIDIVCIAPFSSAPSPYIGLSPALARIVARSSSRDWNSAVS